MARKPKAETPAEDWNAPEQTAGENSAAAGTEHTAHEDHSEGEDLDDQDEGEADAGEAEDTDAAADFAAMSRVDHDAGVDLPPTEVYRQDDAETGGTEGLALGSALTPRQRLGLDAEDVDRHVEQAGDRMPLTNAQTDHERANGLDPVSGTANPGVTAGVRHTAPGPANDMSGKRAVPDPFANLGAQASATMRKLQAESERATSRGQGAGHGWLNLQQLGVHKAVLDGLVASGIVDQDTRPGGQFSPETGTVYRIASHK